MSAPARDPAAASQSSNQAASQAASQEDWKLPIAGERCAACDAGLVPGDAVTSAVRLAETGPERRDLCASCGEAVASEPDLFFWRRELPASAARKPVVDYAMLREIFARLLVRPDPSYQRLAYLVALVLVRKRHLRLVSFEARGGREVMLVRRSAAHPVVEVPAPYLGPEEMVEVREQLAKLMAADLPGEDELFAPPESDAEDGGGGAADPEDEA